MGFVWQLCYGNRKMAHVDVWVRLERKESDIGVHLVNGQKLVKQAQMTGTHFRTSLEAVFWPYTSVIKALKGAAPSLDLDATETDDEGRRIATS
jgi:hypothetical protein